MPTFDSLRAEYTSLWASVEVRSTWRNRVAPVAAAIIAHQARYSTVANIAKVPWWWIGIVHQMESGGDFSTHLHNGDPLSARTVNEPSGRPVKLPLSGKMPYTWEESALDSLSMKPGSEITDWSVEHSLYLLEAYNGFGYRNNHPDTLSPYLWSGTNHYTSGKYIRDGVWSASAVSEQVGAAAILLGLIAAGADVGFSAPVTVAAAPPLPTDSDMKPYEVQAVQRGLASLNYGVGVIDGKPGRLWVQAVSGFQHDHNLPITGHWSQECSDALAAALAEGKPASVAEGRATATTADVKSAGIKPVATAQKLVVGGVTAVVGGVAKAVTDTNGDISIDKANGILDHARAAKGWIDGATGLIVDTGAWIYAHPILAISAIGAAVAFWGAKIGKDAITAYREGRL